MKLKKSEYLQLVGLLALAPKHNDALREIEEAICTIVKVEEANTGGHCGDAVYSGYTADELLKKLKAAYGDKAPTKP